VLTEAKYNSIPNVLKGPIDTALVTGEDWGAWSNEYRFSGESFKSESPRRYVQLELILSTENPEFAATVNALSIEFEEALVQEALGRIAPREARPNEATRFTYALATRTLSADSGFDLLRFTLPEPVELEADVEVRIGGERVDPISVETRDDSLFIELPQRLTTNTLEISFTTRVLANAALFTLDLGLSERSGLWQSVEAATRRANIVLSPELVGSQQLIGDLKVVPPVFTPNGDGINDRVDIRFVVLKVDAPEPQVQVFDLAGRLVASLRSSTAGSLRSFVWDGLDAQGAAVAPGIYLCRIDLGAQTGKDDTVRLIGVAY